ncbi:hypothetical protein BaRGS_00017691 [Batillaria attramentaria]|uniref:Uncharacterized protein n=1 Tax=Batillaria attramentaria TaxID=370345 RepID=A0ABD0KV00_9CAEN
MRYASVTQHNPHHSPAASTRGLETDTMRPFFHSQRLQRMSLQTPGDAREGGTITLKRPLSPYFINVPSVRESGGRFQNPIRLSRHCIAESAGRPVIRGTQ